MTPENNTAVLFWKAMGPHAIPKEYRDRYFQMLGIPPLPETGDYFVDLDKYLACHNGGKTLEGAKAYNKWEQLTPLLKRPWTKRQFPLIAEWLATNEKPLALLVEASKRPRRYDPLVGGKKTSLIAVLQPALSRYGDAAEALVARAMLRLGKGNVDDAWSDILARYRLARLIGQDATAVDGLFAGRINEKAWTGHQALLQHTGLTAAKIARMRDDFNRLPPMLKIADEFDLAERFIFLDAVLVDARDVRPSPDSVAKTLASIEKAAFPVRERGSWKLILESAGDPAIDWDTVLRVGNARYDQCVSVMRKPAGVERRKAARMVDKNEAAMVKVANDKETSERSSSDDRREARSRRLGSAFLAAFSCELAPLVDLDDRATTRFELTKLAFALAAYRADHGSYPAKLADLVPKYVKSVPKDIFNNDADLHYSPKGDGYLLYSVGSNGKDDGGKGQDDRKNNEDWDDLAVRMAASASP